MPTLGRNDARYAEQLNYWEARSTHMLCNTNVAEVGFEISIPSTTMSGDADMVSLHRRIMNVLHYAVPAGERLRLHLEVAPLEERLLSRYGAELKTDNPAARLVSEATTNLLNSGRRKEILNEYRAYVTCTMKIDRSRWQRKRAFGIDEIAAIDNRAWTLRGQLQAALQQAGLSPIPFSPQDHFRIPYRYFNPQLRGAVVPTYRPPEFHLPEKILRKHPELAEPSIRAQLLSSDYIPYTDYAFTAGHFMKIVSMGYQPVGATFTGALGQVLNTPRKFWLVLDYEHKTPNKFLRFLQARARRLAAMTGDTGGLSDYSDPAKEAENQEARGLIAFLQGTGQHMYKVGVSMVLFDRTLEGVQEGAKEAVSHFAQVPSVTPIEESSNLREQFFALAPLSGLNNDFMFLVTEENAADFWLMNGPWTGFSRPAALFWNQYDALTAIDPFDSKVTNYNGVIIGGSGTGKTFFTQSLLSQVMRDGTEVMLVDLKYDYQQLVEFYGGHTVTFGPEGGYCINPFDLPKGHALPDTTKRAFLMGFLRTILPCNESTDIASENTILSAAITQVYARATTTHYDDDRNEIKRYEGTTLSNFVRVLDSIEELEGRNATPDDKKLAHTLAGKFGSFIGNGQYASLFDSPTNVDLDAQIMYFNVQGMADDPRLLPVGLLTIADYMFTRIKRDPRLKKLAVFDEAWALLGIPEAATYMQKLSRLSRSYGGGIYYITQTMEDLLSEGARSILQNTTYHYLLPTPGQEDLVADVLKLPDNAKRRFMGLIPKEQVLAWIRTEDGAVGDVLRNVQPAVMYWAFTSHPLEVAERNRTQAIYNGNLYAALLDLARRYPLGMFRTPQKSEEVQREKEELRAAA